jgi:hypothetical protein
MYAGVHVHDQAGPSDTIYLVADQTIGLTEEELDAARQLALTLASTLGAGDSVRAFIYDRPAGQGVAQAKASIIAGGGGTLLLIRPI